MLNEKTRDPFLVDALAHKHSVALREGARIWKELAPPRKDVVIQISDKEDACIPNWIHVLAINRPLFREVVKNHLLAKYGNGLGNTGNG